MRTRRITAASAHIVVAATIVLSSISVSVAEAASAAAPRAASAFTLCDQLNSRSPTAWTLRGIDVVARGGRVTSIVTTGPGTISGLVVLRRLAKSPNCVNLNPITGEISAFPQVLVPWSLGQPLRWTTPNGLLP
jgi:hypothetical protein